MVRYVVDVPSLDDFDTILAYVNLPPGERLAGLFSQHNEHRLFTTRLAAELLLLISGHIDFRYLVIGGNLALLGVGFLFFLLARRRGLSLACHITMSALIFAPFPWQNMLWPTAAIQNNAVHLFALLSFVLFREDSLLKRAAAVVAAFLAAYTSGSGLLVLPILVAWGITSRVVLRLSRRALLGLAAALLLLLGVYFVDYRFSSSGVSALIESPRRVIVFFILFCGGIYPNFTMALLLGFSILVWTASLLFCRHDRRNSVLVAFMLYLVGSAFMASLARSGGDFRDALEVRYRIIPLLLLASCCYTIMECAVRRRWRRLPRFLAFASVVIFIFALQSAPSKLEWHARLLTRSIRTWSETGKGLIYPRTREAHADAILRESIRKSVYVPRMELVAER